MAKSKKRRNQKLQCHICLRYLTNRYTYNKHLAAHLREEEEEKQKTKARRTLSPLNLKKLSQKREKTPDVEEPVKKKRRTPCSFKSFSIVSLWPDGSQKKTSSLLPSKDSESLESRTDIFVCPKCAVPFGNKDSFNTHLISHVEEYRHECNICLQVFKSMQALNEHKKKHSSKSAMKSFDCDVCGEGFAYLSSLNRHKLSHSQKEYKCYKCDETFSTLAERNRHARSHLIMCHICRIGFLTPDDFRDHLKKVHRCDETDSEESADELNSEIRFAARNSARKSFANSLRKKISQQRNFNNEENVPSEENVQIEETILQDFNSDNDTSETGRCKYCQGQNSNSPCICGQTSSATIISNKNVQTTSSIKSALAVNTKVQSNFHVINPSMNPFVFPVFGQQPVGPFINLNGSGLLSIADKMPKTNLTINNSINYSSSDFIQWLSTFKSAIVHLRRPMATKLHCKIINMYLTICNLLGLQHFVDRLGDRYVPLLRIKLYFESLINRRIKTVSDSET